MEVNNSEVSQSTCVINGREYLMKYSLRIFMVFESIAGCSFESASLKNMIILFYSTLYANNDSFSMSFNEFVDALDEDPGILESFKVWLENEADKRKLLSPQKEEDIDGSKKKP